MSISYEKQGRIGWLVLDRPDKLNTLASADWERLGQIVGGVADDPDVRCVVLHGSGRSFCAGADIEGFDFGSDTEAIQHLAELSMAVLRSVGDLPVPTIAAVHGHAFGAGCELTMVCDIVIADETAVFALPEARVGVMPAMGLLRGRDHIALHVLKYLAFTGVSLDAAGAAAAGMVNSVVATGSHLEEAGRVAASIAANAPLAIRSAKRLLNQTTGDQFAIAVAEVTKLFSSQDVVEGVRAFRSRTPASFQGM
jgi:enoyl-CoA hydratase/carnithine racemase